MHTLFIKTQTENKSFLINTNALKQELVDEIIKQWIDNYPDCDWWIDEGYHIKQTPLY